MNLPKGSMLHIRTPIRKNQLRGTWALGYFVGLTFGGGGENARRGPPQRPLPWLRGKPMHMREAESRPKPLFRHSPAQFTAPCQCVVPIKPHGSPPMEIMEVKLSVDDLMLARTHQVVSFEVRDGRRTRFEFSSTQCDRVVDGHGRYCSLCGHSPHYHAMENLEFLGKR